MLAVQPLHVMVRQCVGCVAGLHAIVARHSCLVSVHLDSPIRAICNDLPYCQDIHGSSSQRISQPKDIQDVDTKNYISIVIFGEILPTILHTVKLIILQLSCVQPKLFFLSVVQEANASRHNEDY